MTTEGQAVATGEAVKPGSKKWIIAIVLVPLLAVATFLLGRHYGGNSGAGAAAEEPVEAGTPVVVTPAEMRIFKDQVLLQGNVEAKNYALVSPRIPGVIESILVDEGDLVKANETKLFQTDSLSLEKAVQIKENQLAVAACGRRQAVANLDKTKTDLHKAELDYNRFKRLFENKHVTPDAFEQQQSRYEQLQAVLKLAEAQVDLAAEQENLAQAALAIARKDLADASVYAPVDGLVSVRFKEPGEEGNPGQPVLRIDDVNVVELAAFLPAQYYSSVVPGKTVMNIQVANLDVGERTITYRSPTIHNKLRTFEIKCVLADPPDGVVPGAMAHIAVVLDSHKALGVPVAAIERRADRDVVFDVVGDKARKVPVETGIENDGWIEISKSDLKEGAPVVTMGQYQLDDGTVVAIQQEDK